MKLHSLYLFTVTSYRIHLTSCQSIPSWRWIFNLELPTESWPVWDQLLNPQDEQWYKSGRTGVTGRNSKGCQMLEGREPFMHRTTLPDMDFSRPSLQPLTSDTLVYIFTDFLMWVNTNSYLACLRLIRPMKLQSVMDVGSYLRNTEHWITY